jgi:hypothetical protein
MNSADKWRKSVRDNACLLWSIVMIPVSLSFVAAGFLWQFAVTNFCAGRHWHEVWLDELCEWSEE